MFNQSIESFSKIFEVTQNSEIGIFEIFIVLILAFILGYLISLVYKWVHTNISFSTSFVLALTILPAVTAIIMLTIGSNLARAFGLVGALAIIRFRTPIKDTKDIVFILLSLSAGIITGTQNYHIAIVGIPIILLAIFLLYKINFGESNNSQSFLTIILNKNKITQSDIDSILNKYCQSYSVTKINSVYKNQNEIEFIYKISIDNRNNKKQVSLISELNQLEINKLSLTSLENYSQY